MDTFIGGAAVAALSGLAFVAYNHRRFFAWIVAAASVCMGVFIIGFMFWNTGRIFTAHEALAFIPPERHSEAIVALTAWPFHPMKFVLIFLGVWVYVMVLFYLPQPKVRSPDR